MRLALPVGPPPTELETAPPESPLPCRLTLSCGLFCIISAKLKSVKEVLHFSGPDLQRLTGLSGPDVQQLLRTVCAHLRGGSLCTGGQRSCALRRPWASSPSPLSARLGHSRDSVRSDRRHGQR